jgi:WD40 repeat protein
MCYVHGSEAFRGLCILFSGGADGVVKVWSTTSKTGTHYLQTLIGHGGPVTR